VLIEETEKEREKQDKTIINQLSKTIAEISKVLADFDMAPPILSKISNIVSMNYNGQGNQYSEEIGRLRVLRQQAKSAITIPSSNKDQYDNKEGGLEEYDTNAVF
jgi:DNA-directed RNA polymerase subunit L